MAEPSNGLDLGTLGSRVAALIRQNIMEMREGFEPGSRLNPREMARTLGVSETPLKRALQMLEAEGLVEVLPRRGTYVSQLSRRDVDELLDVRAGLEMMALRMTGGAIPQPVLDRMAESVRLCEQFLAQGDSEQYRHWDAVFHECIIDASGNRRMKQVYESLTTSVQLLNVYSLREKSHRTESQHEHGDLVEVFRQGNLARSEAALQQHWEGSKQRLTNAFKSYLSADASR